MTKEELNYIKDAFSQIIDDIAGNPDWDESARAVASDLGTLERKLEENISPLPFNLDEAAIQAAQVDMCDRQIMEDSNEHRMLYSRIFRRGFKAGAEWMAGQGYTKEETVYFERLCDENRIMVDLGWGEPERGGFNPGDKVVVQIRKK